jgi:mycobactin lysine-N-oxygenase
MPKKIAVIGGGPKGAAVASKAAALGARKSPTPEISIYEPDAFGAAWTGSHGYTDGEQPLCTIAERDVGFPYDHASFGMDVAIEMAAQYSWQAYSVARGTGRAQYEAWVNYGRKPPTHKDFADYLTYVIQKSGANHLPERVIGLDHQNGYWLVTSVDATQQRNDRWFDGVVVTGSGDPLPPLPGSNARVIDGKAFWKQLPAIQHLLGIDPDPAVVIIGAGGTAAAIAHWFVRAGITSIPITIVGREPTLYARHPGPFEDRLFSDSDAWDLLVPHARESFVRRLTTGVVWDYVLQRLTGENISYQCYEVRRFSRLPGPSIVGFPPALHGELFDPDDPTQVAIARYLAAHGYTSPPSLPATSVGTVDATVFIDARGFDNWWFANLFPPTSPLRLALANRDVIRSEIDYSLAVNSTGGQFPENLHLPMLATIQGPAARDLMALGWMSDRILSAY